MSRNINDVYGDNPSTALDDDDLIYLGKSPYTAVDDSAILVSNIFATRTDGGIYFADSNKLAQDPTTLFWDKTTDTLYIGDVDTMTIGGTAIATRLGLHQDGAITNTCLELHKHSDTAAAGALSYYARSRGTEGAETIVQNNDNLGYVYFVGYDGTDYEQAGYLSFQINGTPSTTSMPTSFTVALSASGSVNPTNRLHILANGFVGLTTSTPQNRLDVSGSAVVGASFAGSTAGPTDGMLIQGRTNIGGNTNVNNFLNVSGSAVIGASYAASGTAPSQGLLIEGAVVIGVQVSSALLTVGSNTSNATVMLKTTGALASNSYLSFGIYDSSEIEVTRMGVYKVDKRFVLHYDQTGVTGLATEEYLSIDTNEILLLQNSTSFNIGIGTSSPYSPTVLHIACDKTAPSIVLQETDTVSPGSPTIVLENYDRAWGFKLDSTDGYVLKLIRYVAPANYTGGGAEDQVMRIEPNGRGLYGLGATTSGNVDAIWHMNQSSVGGGYPVAFFEQHDPNQPCFVVSGTAGATVTNTFSTLSTPGSLVEWLMIKRNGTRLWIPMYGDPS